MSARAVTITLNPAIDQTVRLAHLRPGNVHRARSSRDDAGGKGINVAACLADWGVPTTALGVLGDGNDGVFSALFAERGIADACLRVAGRTRTNIKLVEEASGETTDVLLFLMRRKIGNDRSAILSDGKKRRILQSAAENA